MDLNPQDSRRFQIRQWTAWRGANSRTPINPFYWPLDLGGAGKTSGDSADGKKKVDDGTLIW